MLQDKDRIFKNLYGFQDWRLAGAKARGAWDNTKGLIDKGHDWIITEMRNSLVHPSRRKRLTATPLQTRIDLQEMALWYAELALLRLIGYQGDYANRLGAKMTGIVEKVPWS